MTEENIELLAPNNPNLKDPRQCAYREGREYHEQGLDMMQVLNIVANKSSKFSNLKFNEPSIRSMVALWYFNLGIDGDMCELELRDWKGKDYCKEGCKLNCKYRSHSNP